MRLILRFIIIAALLAFTLPLPPLGVLVGALATLWTLEYWRAKNIALKTILQEKWLNTRQRLQARLKDDRGASFEAETEEEALEIDEIARDLADELDASRPNDQLSESWLAKVEQRRAQVRKMLWRFVSAPIRLIGRAILSLTDDDKR